MRRSLLSPALAALLSGLLTGVAATPAQAVTIAGRGFSNHSHDNFSNPPSPGSPFFTGSTNSNGTQYTISPSNGLAGSIRTPNGPGASPIGSSTTVSGHVTITGSATSVGADATANTADDWLNGNNIPTGVTLSYDVLFTISAANGNNLVTATGNTGNGLSIANSASDNYGELDAGEVLNFSALTMSNYVWAGAPTETSFTFTPISTGVTRFTAFRSNSLTILSEGATLSDGTNTWGFGTSTGNVVSNIPIANGLGATFSPAGGDVPLTLTTDVGAWSLKGFQLSTPISYEITAAAAPINADFNNDTFVDGADFLIWQRNYGLAAGALLENGDANADGAVNDLDLTAWKDKYGAGAGATPPVASVPEPAGLTLVATALLAAGAARRRW